jgi:hypothetical protein
MKRCVLFLLLILLIRCSDKSSEIGIDKVLYELIQKYQSKYPIPEDKSKLIYVYFVDCFKENNDTIIRLGRSAAGISKSDKVYGVYENEELKPTFIFDQSNLCDKLIMKKVKNKNNDRFYRNDNGSYPESYPPIYKYKLKNNELTLMKIDTIWLKWD